MVTLVALWGIFFIVLVITALIDHVLLPSSHAHHMPVKEAATRVFLWISAALLFNVFLWRFLLHADPAVASTHSLSFLAGYLIEWSLSLDNLFVFLLIFSHFQLPDDLQKRVLFYGILGAIILRLLFIVLGVWLIAQFHSILYLFGIFLIGSGLKILFQKGKQHDLSQNPLLLWMRKHLPLTAHLEGKHFLIYKNKRWYFTPLFVIVCLIEATDILFAIDSIPAIFIVTRDPFLLFTSNVFAIMGLRATYFLLAHLHERFYLLKYGVGLILVAIGSKMLLSYWFAIPVALTLLTTLTILTTSIVLSLVIKKNHKRLTNHATSKEE